MRDHGGGRLTLDVWLVERLAAELRESLVGARIQNAVGDGSGLRLDCYRRGGALTMRATFDSDGPLMAVHRKADAGNENVAGGWAGGVAPLLRGCSVESVQAVPNDRIIIVDVVSRSAFGVPARHRLTFELEPNKANILVLRFTEDERWHILAAAKEIEGATGARSIVVGETYEAPPSRRTRLNSDDFSAAVAGAVEHEPRALTRLLAEYDPACSPPLARETIERAGDANGRQLAERLLDAWVRLRVDVSRAAADVTAPVYGWRRADGGYAVAHVIRLTWPPGTCETVSALNDFCEQQQIAGDRKRRAPAAAALRKRLTTMIDRCDAEMDQLRAAERRGAQAGEYRIAGESIYTYLADIPERAESFVTPEGLRIALDPLLSAKENAAAYFRRFKKARSGLPRVAARLATLIANRAYWEGLLWELERAQSASADDLSVVCDEITDTIGSRKTQAKRAARRRTAPAPVELPGGAVAHVGRSPKDNERVTFSVAAPNDLWFHARGIPGAHVVLKLSNPRDRATDEQILAAAALAAGQSRAADAQKVEVDYAQRKHVRKQGGGKVGLVWYTDFKTVLVQPRKL